MCRFEDCGTKKIFPIRKELNNSFQVINPNLQYLCEVKVDGGLINTSEIKKCDWMYKILDTKNKALECYFLFELKGKGKFDDVFEQFESTYNYLKSLDQVHSKVPRIAFAVSTGIPKKNSQTDKLSIRLKRNTGIDVKPIRSGIQIDLANHY
ncbi:hypothetical protein [Acinetobacter pittii]|uniref:hypothetical protein n=1 Tax=Acinetobacter pittii TaxID=48296 RepID=UPI0021D26CF4|nr:hypothetical protein [Acinetobacter pittii]MCU4443863.1 hypothetical protein [Acinetobacter pittii]